MADRVHSVRFEPMGVEMDVNEGETVLDAAFRQGISVMHGCKEGQCSSCKSRLVDGDIELLKYSTFALPDYDRDTDHILLCRTLAYSDIVVELLNYDEDLMRRSIAVKAFGATLTGITPLTHDIRMLEIALEAPLRFWSGQYVDLTIPGAGITRAFSMANPPSEQTNLRFIIKKYPEGAFSALLDGGLAIGDRLIAKGPYGTCFRREGRQGSAAVDRRRFGDVTAAGRYCTTTSKAANNGRCASSMARAPRATCSTSRNWPRSRRDCAISASSRRCRMPSRARAGKGRPATSTRWSLARCAPRR